MSTTDPDPKPTPTPHSASPTKSPKKLEKSKQSKENNSSSSKSPKLDKSKQSNANEPKPSLLRTTIIRSAVGIVMMVAFSLILQLPHNYISGLVVLSQIVAWQELVSLRYKAIKEKQLENTLFRTINWYFLFLAFLYFYGRPALTFLATANIHPSVTDLSKRAYHHYNSILFSAYVLGMTTFILTLRRKTLKYQLGQFTWTIMSLLLVVGQTHFAIQYLNDGLVWLLLPHGLIIVNDIAAYFCGVLFGRYFINRSLTALSPNKTWEGFIGAMIFTVIFSFCISPFFSYSDWLVCPSDQYPCVHNIVFQPSIYQIPDGWRHLLNDWGIDRSEITLYPIQLHAVFFALFASLIAPFGGFLASGIKRAYNKKDFDNLFPGHGGFMDRFDCQLLMCSFVYIYVTTFINISDTTQVAKILSNISLLREDLQKEILYQLQKKFVEPPV